MSTRHHLLLTVLGTNPSEARYVLDGRVAIAQLAPIALLDLLPDADKPDKVVALCTPEARSKTWPLLEQALGESYPSECVEVTSGQSQGDIDKYLKQVLDAIPGDQAVDLTVDVTHGYRHFSFLTYVAVLYLTALRGVRVRGAYYGMLRRDEPSPFLDLRPLLALPRWVHALQVLRETGSALPIAAVLGDGTPSQSAQAMARDLSQLSEAYLSGLPLELGQQASHFREQRPKPLRRLLRDEHSLPLANELVENVMDALEPFTLSTKVSGDGWKRQVELSRPELERQAHLIDELLQRESLATALGLMNEWTVSWVAWRQSLAGGWLDYQKVRRRAAGMLGAIAAIGSAPDLQTLLNPEQRALGSFWRLLCELRNAYHHHGMRPQVLVGNRQFEEKLANVLRYWRETLHAFPEFSLSIGLSSGGRVLISPVGRRPGVLFSAVQAARTNGHDMPAAFLVICSQETEARIAEALRHAGFGGPVERLILKDPYGGLSEIEPLVRAARRSLVGADEVLVNVTGGTTLMGLLAQKLADEARSLARPVRRFGLIDRRPPKQQDLDPYQAGEPFWLDDAEVGDANNNH